MTSLEIQSLIESQKVSYEIEKYNRTEFVTINFKSLQVNNLKSLEEALLVICDYIFVISFFDYSYFENTNQKMKLVLILDKSYQKTNHIDINSWKLIFNQDGYTGSYYQNDRMLFKLIDKTNEVVTDFQWSLSSDYAATIDLKRLFEITRNFYTYREYDLTQKLLEAQAKMEQLSRLNSQPQISADSLVDTSTQQ